MSGENRFSGNQARLSRAFLRLRRITEPGFARRTAEGGCPHMGLRI